MKIYETELNEKVMEDLIRLSVDWENENSCYGYRANTEDDIKDNRIFIAEDNGEIVGYLFGHNSRAERMSSIIPDGTAIFEVMEAYVIPERRSQGIGKALFSCMEEKVADEVEYTFLSTATKNHKAILHFYIDEADMTFWSASLFKKM